MITYNKYQGRRYVPKIFGEWQNGLLYEALTIVTYKGDSYTSKKDVPVGIDISNNGYWVQTGNYNAQLQNYKNEVNRLKVEVEEGRLGEESLKALNEKFLAWLEVLSNKTILSSGDVVGLENALIKGGTIELNEGSYSLSKNLVCNKNVILRGNGKVSIRGKYTISFNGEIGTPVSCTNINRGQDSVTVALQTFVPNDVVAISGTIVDTKFTPERLTSYTLMAQVISIEGNKINLDRTTSFSLDSCTISKVNPIQVNVENVTLNNSSLSLTAVKDSNVKINASGMTATSSPTLAFSKCLDSNFNCNFNNLITNHGVVINNCANVNGDVISNNTGRNDGAIVKVLRGNGVQNSKFNLNCVNSYTGELGFIGSRDNTFVVQSYNSGKYFTDNNITTGNRLESIQFSEGYNTTVNAKVVDNNDQAIEYLAMVDSQIIPIIKNRVGGSEGSVVIKAGSSNVQVVNPILNCNNPYGIKIELDPYNGFTTNNISIMNPNIVNNTGVGIAIRDGVGINDTNIKIIGGFIQGTAGMTVALNHNNVNVDGTTFRPTSTHGIDSLSDYNKYLNVTVQNTTTVSRRAIVSSGANDIVSNATIEGTGVIYVRGEAKDNFNIDRYKKCDNRIFIDGGVLSIWATNRGYGVSQPPAIGSWNTDYLLINNLPKELGATGSKYIIDSWHYSGTSWIEHRTPTGN